MRSILRNVAIVAVLVGGFFAYDFYEKTFNYTTANAVVTKVEEMCSLVKRAYKSKTYTDELPCPVAEQAKATNPKYEDFNIERKTYVDYDYEVDGKKLHGKHVQSAHADGRKIKSGETLAVLVSKTDSSKTRAP